ncbi:unknown [Prevotella sp. CAG:1124]|nr:unknown [Prevotella sp. CAG:1124]
MSVIERRGVVGAVAGDGHYLAALLQQVDKSLLVGRPRTAHHAQLGHALVRLVVAQGGEVRTSYLRLGWRFGVPNAYLAGYFDGCCRRVAGYYLDVNSRTDALFHGVGHVKAYRVADGCYGLERQFGACGNGSHVGLLAVGQHTVGESQRTHGLVLVSAQAVAYLLACLGGDVAERSHNLGRALDHQYAFAAYLSDGGHVFSFGRERQLRLDVLVLAEGAVVNSVLLKPQQQCDLCRVTDTLAALFVEVGGGVQGYGRAEKRVVSVVLFHVGHLHFVLRQGTRLVGADYRNGAHCLAGVQLAHKVIVLQHAPHVEREAQCYGHRHALGHGHNYQRYGHHEVLQHRLGHTQIVRRRPNAFRIKHYVTGEEYDEGGYGYADTELADEFCQLVELQVERRLDSRYLGTCARHLANLGRIAHLGNLIRAASVHNHRAAQHF